MLAHNVHDDAPKTVDRAMKRKEKALALAYMAHFAHCSLKASPSNTSQSYMRAISLVKVAKVNVRPQAGALCCM